VTPVRRLWWSRHCQKRPTKTESHLPDTFPDGVKAAHAQLLAQLGVGSVDLLLLDVSAAAQGSADPLPPPVAAAWTALCELHTGGTTLRAVGVAHAGWRTLEALLALGGVKPTANLCELHPLLSQVRVHHCAAQGEV
jgi:diketogulonate reductase-like aldo/keto reductase